MNGTSIKRRLASIFDAVGLNAAGFLVQRSLFSPFIRVVNYHDIPDELAPNFESHLAYYSSHFVNVDESALRSFLDGSPWPHEKPGIIISFDDGLASHIGTALPLIEKYGFTGWFFLPAERLTASNGKGETVMTAADALALDSRHVIGCHTNSHLRLGAEVGDDALRSEVIGAKRSMEKNLGHAVDIFCWVGGEEYAYSAKAANLIRENYDLGFMTNNAVIRRKTNPMQLQRTNIEADNPLSLVRFQLAGFLDLFYFAKRRRVNRLTR
jgi:peptidoglycan/xylan/chitin deacetylase (PgdA/CDA1 family)